MSEEQKLILKMLEEGKITAEQAAKMLDYCSTETTTTYTVPTSAEDRAEALAESDEANAELGTALAKLTQEVDLAKLIKGFMRGGLSFNIGSGYRVDKVVEGQFGSVPAAVELQGRHGALRIAAWDSDGYKAELEARVKATSEEEAEKLLQEGLSIQQAPDRLAVIITDSQKVTSLNIKLYVPRQLLSLIQAKTTHGSVVLSDLQAGQLSVTTRHGRIDCSQVTAAGGQVKLKSSHGSVNLEAVEASSIEVDTSHAAIALDGVTARDLALKTSHGSIKGECAASKIKASTSHAAINLHLSQVNPGEIELSTKHGSIRLSGEVPEDIGVSFAAKNSHGSVKLINPCMRTVQASGKTDVCYTSENFDSTDKKLYITAETRFASIYFE